MRGVYLLFPTLIKLQFILENYHLFLIFHLSHQLGGNRLGISLSQPTTTMATKLPFVRVWHMAGLLENLNECRL